MMRTETPKIDQNAGPLAVLAYAEETRPAHVDPLAPSIVVAVREGGARPVGLRMNARSLAGGALTRFLAVWAPSSALPSGWGLMYGYANRLGYGFCQPCAEDREEDLNEYTPEDQETCDRCGARIRDKYVPSSEDRPGIEETFVCRIF